MKQYIDLAKRIINSGTWVENERTGKRCLTVTNEEFVYDVGNNKFPLITTRKSYWKSAIAEMLGYLRGYASAKDFRELGTNTWNANANENEQWLNNPYRKGKDDMGLAYRFRKVKGIIEVNGELVRVEKDPFKEIIDLLSQGKDNRRLIMSAWNPLYSDFTCLEPCMYSHHFKLINGVLDLYSTQRSVDTPIGLNFNQVQCFFLLAIVAQITGNKAGKVYHKMIDCHIYEDQLDLMQNVQIKRQSFKSPKLHINPNIKTLEDLETWVTLNDFSVEGYQHHEPIKYPFAV